jgi:outer membrane receptor protein involved in Fe transport
MIRLAFVRPIVCLGIAACAAPSGAKQAGTAPSPTAEKSSTVVVANAESKTLADLFRGKFAGVDVTQEGQDGVRIKIRDVGNRDPGNFEQTGGSGPLYVVDGLEQQAPGGVFHLDPTLVQKIEIEKVSSLYGIKGANGVVKITTKRK